MAAQRRKKIWNTRRLPQQSDEPGLQQWWKWHKKEFLKNKINTRIQKNLMCWKKKKKGEKTSHQGAPFNWRSYSEALATMRLWKGVEKHKYIRVANPAGNTQRCKSQTHGDGREPWKKRAICRCVSVGDFAGVENQISYRLHLGRERIYTRREKGKSNKMKSSRREPTLIHLFFVVMFFVMGEVPLGVGANDKSISAIKQWLFSLSLPPLFFGQADTHKTPAAAVFMLQPNKQQWPPKNAHKNSCASCAVSPFWCCSFTAGLVASSTTAAAATQAMNYGESVRGRRVAQ